MSFWGSSAYLIDDEFISQDIPSFSLLAPPFHNVKLLRLRPSQVTFIFLLSFVFLTGCQSVTFWDHRPEEPKPERTFIGHSLDENGKGCRTWEDGKVSKTYCDYTGNK